MTRLRVAGHALTVEWSGETGIESSSTGTCKCGRWTESGSSRAVVQEEYRWHLRSLVCPPPHDLTPEQRLLAAVFGARCDRCQRVDCPRCFTDDAGS